MSYGTYGFVGLYHADLSIVTHQDQLDLWAPEVFPPLVKACCICTNSVAKQSLLCNIQYAFSRICSLISADVADHIVKEVISVICENIEVGIDLNSLYAIVFHLPISQQNQAFIIHKVESIFESYLVDESCSSSLSFEVMDRVFDENRYQHDLLCCHLLMKYSLNVPIQ